MCLPRSVVDSGILATGAEPGYRCQVITGKKLSLSLPLSLRSFKANFRQSRTQTRIRRTFFITCGLYITYGCNQDKVFLAPEKSNLEGQRTWGMGFLFRGIVITSPSIRLFQSTIPNLEYNLEYSICSCNPPLQKLHKTALLISLIN